LKQQYKNFLGRATALSSPGPSPTFQWGKGTPPPHTTPSNYDPPHSEILHTPTTAAAEAVEISIAIYKPFHLA